MENTGTSRRAILIGAGSAGAVVLLGACASHGTSSTPADTNPPAVQGPIDLGPASDVPVGGGTVYPNHAAVVTQPAAGQFKAFSAICTHMHCTVGDVSNGTINCPCHGSRYSITDGSVVQGPAPKPLAAKPLTVNNGELTLG